MKLKKTHHFINKGENKFFSIESEISRTYRFPNKELITINNPLMLCVKDNGHRVFDAQGVCHYIPTGWLHLSWEVKEGEPHFVK